MMKRMLPVLMLALIVGLTIPAAGDLVETPLIAGGGNVASAINVGNVQIWNADRYLYVKYTITNTDWCLKETHMHVATSLSGIPQTKKGNPIPGHFTYSDTHDCITTYTYSVPLTASAGTSLYVATHAVVEDKTCYETGDVYGIERYTGNVYKIDVLSGTSVLEFSITSPPPTTNVGPNGLAYDAVNGRMYYCDYRPTNYLYFWDGSQKLAGSLSQDIAAASFYNGRYYYIDSYPASDDLYEVMLDSGGYIVSEIKIFDITRNAHGWTFDGDIAIKDGIVYGWGRCGIHGRFEFFTYNLVTHAVAVYPTRYTSSLQLAFGSDGILYGHRSGGAGQFYVIDTTNGNVTPVTPTPSPVHLYTDCASGMLCVPRDETAWGAGPGFPGRNWATYTLYTVQ